MVWPIITWLHSQKKPNLRKFFEAQAPLPARFHHHGPERTFRQPLKRLVVGSGSGRIVAGPAPVALGWLGRSDHRQHPCPLAVSVLLGHRLLLQNNVLIADGTDHRSECFAIRLQEAVETHHASATN